MVNEVTQRRHRRGFRGLIRCALAVSWLAAAGCSLAVNSDKDQCSTDRDCTARGPTFANTTCVKALCQPMVDPAWACLEKPAETPNAPGPFKVRMRAQNIIGQAPIAEVRVQVCQKLDPDCTRNGNAGEGFTDGNGEVELEIAAGFTGNLYFTREGYMPGLYFFNPAVREDTPAPIPVQLALPGIAAGLAAQVGVELDETRGLILVNSFNCEGAPAEGVTYSSPDLDDVAVRFFSVGGLPVETATATDSAGYGGYVNVRHGNIVINGNVEATGAKLGTVSVSVNAGAISYTRLVPLGR